MIRICIRRGYRFGKGKSLLLCGLLVSVLKKFPPRISKKEKSKPKPGKTMVDVEVEKLFLSHATDYDAVRAEVKEVFNPYDQLGINKMAPLAEIQLKLKAKKRIINEELKQIEGGSNLPAVYEDRLGVESYRFISSELTFIRLNPLKRKLKIFSTL